MMRRTAVGCAVVAAWSAIGLSAHGQAAAPPADELAKELRRLSERLEALEDRHNADQRKIGELEERLQQVERGAAPADRAKQIEEIKEAVKAELGETPVPGPLDLSSASVGATAYNPQMTVFIDTGVNVSSDGSNKALNRFNLREVELDLRAAISPSADGVLILAIPEEIESDRSGDIDIARELEIEEGFINFHTLPHDTALKLGKFRAAFGRNNLLHTHDLPQVTRPLALQTFFGPEGLAALGASGSWLVPNPWDQYIELMVEVVNADGGAESPILGGPNADNPAVVAHLKFFRDITPTSSFELGGSYVFTDTSSDSDFDANIFGLDATYKWVHPDPGKFRSLILQGEVFWAKNDVDRGIFGSGRNDSLGAYAFGQYQIRQNWYVGLRGDYAEFPNSESRGTSDWDAAFSPYVTWYLTEFLRARLEYQHRVQEVFGDSNSEEAVFLQFTGVFGSHPAHPYWVNR